MGPGDAPSRPKFHWDLRNPPWTDGRGPQEQYYNAVKLWKTFHGKLPESNNNKIPGRLQGLILQSQLYDRALDLVKKVKQKDIESEDGALKVASAIYKHDVLSLVTDTFLRFLDVLRIKQGESESFKGFESRFDAQICKLNATCVGFELPQALVSFLLLANSRIDSAQRVSILSAATPLGISTEGRDAEEILSMLSYQDIASVIRACDDPRNSNVSNYRSNNSLNIHLANRAKSPYRYGYRRKAKLTPEQLADLKSKSICNRCHKKGHCSTDLDKCEMAAKEKGISESIVNSSKIENWRQKNSMPSHAPRVTKDGTLHFNMASITANNDVIFTPGPLVDDAAPYSGLGFVELRTIAKYLLKSWNGKLEPVPKSVRDKHFWQYGSGSHASDKRKILGSVVLTAMSDEERAIEIRHLVVDGSSQWVIGRNVTRACNIQHLDGNYLEFLVSVGSTDKISLIDVGDHSFLPASKFVQNKAFVYDSEFLSLTCSLHAANISWSDTKKIVDKVHKHTCGHSSFEDIKLLLQRNHMWSEQCSKYLSHLLDTCKACSLVKASSGSRKVSLRSMSRGFNDVVCVDHFFPEDLDVFHIMDAKTRYSSGALVSSTTLRNAITVFDALWISEFWPPDTVQADQAFNKREFTDYLKVYGIKLRPVPPRRHSKNVLESKHRILRDIYMRLKFSSPNEDPRLLISKMFRVSNDLYGNDVASAHELAKGYTRPIMHDFPRFLPQEIRKAHDELIAKRKLNLILSSKSISESPVRVGDVIQIYVKLENQKRGTWSEPRPVLSYDPDLRTVTVPGAHGRRRSAAIEDIRLAISDDNLLAREIQSAIDLLSLEIQDTVDDLPSSSSTLMTNQDDEDSDYMMNDQFDETLNDGNNDSGDIVGANIDNDVQDNVNNENDGHDDDLEAITYTPAVPSTFDPDAPLTESYSKWSKPAAPSVHHMQLRSRQDNGDDEPTIRGHEIELLPGTELTSSEQEALKLYHDRFEGKEFLLHHAEGLPSYITNNSYAVEEQNFMKHCIPIHRSEVPCSANIISSHVLYKVKQRDDGSLTCKARIAPHGNEDKDRFELKTDSACCPPLGIRILFSLCQLYHWYLSKIDVKSAFLQTGTAQRDVYVILPRECKDRQFIWLLTVATYGLVNANSKWQIHSDQTFIDLGLQSLVYVPQLFYMNIDQKLQLVVVKVTDDILVGGDKNTKKVFINQLGLIYELGTITHLPGTCLFFGLEVRQTSEFVIHVNADNKLKKISALTPSRFRRKQSAEALNTMEQFHFNSVNGSIGFIGVHALPIAAFVSSYLQQRRNTAKVRDMSIQSSLLKKLCRYGSMSTYCTPPNGVFQLSIVVFADAARPSEHGQLGYLSGLLIGPLQNNTPFHVLSWSSFLSKRPAKSSGSAEVLAASAAFDEGMLISCAISTLLSTTIPIIIIVDSKDLFDSLTSCHVPEDRSIRADVQLIRYYFETKQVNKVIWVPGSTNLADPLTKKDSVLNDALQLLLFQGRLPFDFPKSIHRHASSNLG